MYLPRLSEYHTIENSQGTLDPLGLYSIADRLAGYLAPSLRERMKHPRYLTAIAVGSVICSDFDEDEVASDGISQPWQVYEWYVASAFVKRFENDNIQLLGLPGREKTTNAKKSGISISASRYLKTPSVFGFHGVYRTLAKGIDLISDNGLGEFGSLLVDIWENEQNLPGFKVRVGSKGKVFRDTLFNAIKMGLASGAVSKQWNWNYFNTIAECLAPKSPGKKEAALLFQKLTEDLCPCRKELIYFLNSTEGQLVLNTSSERDFHNQFIRKANEAKQIIMAIQAYERVSRLLFNAFYECLISMLKNQNKGSLNEMSKLYHVQKAFKELPAAFAILDENLEPYKLEAFNSLEKFLNLRDSASIKNWLKLLFNHHSNVQRQKPPSGKAPWVLEHSEGNYLLNYTRAINQDLSDQYVHQYRTFCLQSFLKDLGKI